MISIYYIGLLDLLSKKAHAYTVSKTCEALNARDDISLTFVTAHSGSPQKNAALVFTMNKIKKPFPIVVLKSLWDSTNLSKFYLPFRVVSANYVIFKYLWRNRDQYQVIYTRDHLLVFAVFFAKLFFAKQIFYEIHYIYNNRRNRILTDWLAKISNGVIAITKGLENYYEKINEKIITVFCSGVELADYDNLLSDRETLGLPQEKILIGYTGNMVATNLNDPYGLEEVIAALKFLPEEYYFVGVGDKGDDARILMEVVKKSGVAPSRIIILPWQARQKIPAYLASFDILIVPKAGGRPGNSPTKMIEYMASGKPIVACKTAPIMEILRDNENCLLVDNEPSDWACAIEQIYEDGNLAQKLIERARTEAAQYTWEKRAERIAGFIGENCCSYRECSRREIFTRKTWRRTIKKIFWYTVYFSGLNFLYNLFVGERLILVGYHSVSKNNKDCEDYCTLTVNLDDFARQVEYLKRNHKIINLTEIANGLCSGAAIFFDDGFKDVYLNARPILKKEGVRATIFLTTDLIDQKDILWTIKLKWLKGINPETEKLIDSLKDLPRAERENKLAAIFVELKAPLPKIFMDWQQVCEALDVFDYGSHGVTHTDFDEMSEKEISAELEASKAKIEQEIRQPVLTVSYPHGKYTNIAIEAVKKAGFQLAVSTKKGAQKNPDLFILPRISPAPDDDLIFFKLRLGIYYPLLAIIRKFI